MLKDKPLPTTEAGWNLLFQNLKAKLPGYGSALSLTLAEIAAVVRDAENFNYLITVAQQVNDSKDAFFAFKDLLIEGDISSTIVAEPTFPTIVMPEDAMPGIKKRFRKLIQRIKTANGYTDQIGEDLGLLENVPNSIVPQDVVPELKLKALTGSRVEITFSKKGFDAMRVEFQRKGDTVWHLDGIYTRSPATSEIAPVVPGEPETRSYRGVLMENNIAVTQYSPTYTIVTTP